MSLLHKQYDLAEFLLSNGATPWSNDSCDLVAQVKNTPFLEILHKFRKLHITLMLSKPSKRV